MNQGSISQTKGGDQAIYLEFVIICQILQFPNPDPQIDLDRYAFKDNEVLLFVPFYNRETGLYQGLKKKLRLVKFSVTFQNFRRCIKVKDLRKLWESISFSFYKCPNFPKEFRIEYPVDGE